MAMAPIDDDNLPEGLHGDLHRLLPSLPANLADRERGMLDQAHLAMTRQRGRRTGWRWLAAGSAAAAVLLALTLFHTTNHPIPTSPAPAIAAAKPTIIDAMLAARRSGANQADIDRIALAAVRLDSPEVH